MPRTISEVDRDLLAIAEVEQRSLSPSRDWTDLALVATRIVLLGVLDATSGDIYRRIFNASDPAAGAQALLDVIWDQDVVLGESHEVLTEADVELYPDEDLRQMLGTLADNLPAKANRGDLVAAVLEHVRELPEEFAAILAPPKKPAKTRKAKAR